MAYAELVPDVGVVQRQVGHDEVGQQQFLEHVGANVTGTLFFVSADHLQPSRLQRRLDVLRIDAVEVDKPARGIRLGAEGHGDESVGFHSSSPWEKPNLVTRAMALQEAYDPLHVYECLGAPNRLEACPIGHFVEPHGCTEPPSR